jgi:hypothetical protein
MPKRKQIKKRKKMAHISRLPPEIWQMILRYSISVPDFLDPDEGLDQFPPRVIAQRGWSDSSSYYEAERTRNVLQRVCRSWNSYLQQYAHRFVRIDDVVHGNVPLRYLQSAIRFSVGAHGHQNELCYDCKPN